MWIADTHKEALEDRHTNMLLSTFQQFWFMAAACFLMCDCLAMFKAVTKGVIGGSTISFTAISFGAAAFNLGATLHWHGHDLGTDPEAFIGWDNETKLSFFYGILTVLAVSLFIIW